MESCRLDLGEAVNRSEWGLLTLLEIYMVIVCRVVVGKFVGLALAKNVKKVVVLMRNLIKEGFEFLRIKGIGSRSGSREADFCTTKERFWVRGFDLKYTGLFNVLSMHPECCGIDEGHMDRLCTCWRGQGCGGCQRGWRC